MWYVIRTISAQGAIRKQTFFSMDFSSEDKAKEGWTPLKSSQIALSNCEPSNIFSNPNLYGTRNQFLPKSNIYNCLSDPNKLPYIFEITREVRSNLPHYQINFDVEFILFFKHNFSINNNSFRFGNWAIEGINGCTKSDYIQLIADQKIYKFTIQNAITDQNACKNPSDGYLVQFQSTLEHYSPSLTISLSQNSLSDFTMVSFGIRKFDITSNLCLEEKCISCKDQYTCLKCSENYLVSSDGHTCLQYCPQNYLIKAGKCVKTCGLDSILDVATKTCIVCDSNCFECQSSTYCKKCNTSFYLFRGLCYSSCPADSVFPQDGSNQCQECSKGCIECDSTGTCKQCVARYALVNGKCEQCVDPNCQICQNGSLYGCLKCDNDYFFSEKKCISDKCQDDDYRIQNKECQVCMGGYYYDISSHSCIECNSLCHDCTGVSWDQCKECSSLRWRYGFQNTTDKDIYSSKMGICDCESSKEFDDLSDTCSETGNWDILSDIMLFIIFFSSLWLTFRGKMLYLMNFMYFVQSLALLGFLNISYPYFLQNMFKGFNRVNIPSLFPRAFIVDENRMPMNVRRQVVYFKNSSNEIEDIFSQSKFMLYYDRTSNFLLNITNWIIINSIPLLAFIFIVVYQKLKKKKFHYDMGIRNELIPFFLYHSLVDLFFYIILQFDHTSTNGSIHIAGTIGAALSLIILVFIAYFHTFRLIRSVMAFKKNEKDHNIYRFSIYLRDLNFLKGNIFQQNFRTIQSIKQFVLVCCIVGSYNNPVTQAILVLVFQFIYYMILLIIRPFSQEYNNREQIIYETLLFFCVFLSCWYEFSFGLEGQDIKKVVAIILIISILSLLTCLMTITLYNFYKTEKPIYKQYMIKKHKIANQKNNQQQNSQMKKNQIIQYPKNEANQNQNNNYSQDSDSNQSDSKNQNKSNVVNNSNQYTSKKNSSTPKHILPNGLNSSKNQVQPTTNQNANSYFNNDQELNIHLGPNFQSIDKQDITHRNNSVLISEFQINPINGEQSRRHLDISNNHSMSYYLNETNQNIITETEAKQFSKENPHILSGLDYELNQNLDIKSAVRLSERNEIPDNNNPKLKDVDEIANQQDIFIQDNHLNKQVHEKNNLDVLKRKENKEDSTNNHNDQFVRSKTEIHNRNQYSENHIILGFLNQKHVRANTQIGFHELNQQNISSKSQNKNVNENQSSDINNQIAHNNFHSESKNNLNSIQNQEIQSMNYQKAKGVFQQAGVQLTNSQKKQNTTRGLRDNQKPFKFATKKKKSMLSSNEQQLGESQKQQVPLFKVPDLKHLHQQTDDFIKKSLDTELMYIWKDQQYNYDNDNNDENDDNVYNNDDNDDNGYKY